MCDPILVTSENVNPLHYSQFSHENVAPSSGTFPLASYKEVAPLPPVVWCSGESTCLPPVWLGIKEEIWFKLPAQQICHLLMPAKHRIKESQFDSCLISRVKSQVYSLKTNPNELKLEVRELNPSLLRTTEGSFTMYVLHGKMKTDWLTDYTQIACWEIKLQSWDTCHHG